MEYRIYKTTTKKRGDQWHLHTASCSQGDRLKKRVGKFTKIEVNPTHSADDVADGFEKVHKLRPVIHPKCTKLFRRMVSKNPPCPHCGNSTTVFASNIGVGKKEFTCINCKKMFVHLKPKKETAMKIKIQKSAAKATAKKSTKKSKAVRQAERIQRREARKIEREQKKIERQKAREQKKADRAERAELRKGMRAARSVVRLNRLLDRFDTMGFDTKVIRKWVKTDLPKPPAAKDKKTSKRKAKK